jgi:hypothetical protein
VEVINVGGGKMARNPKAGWHADPAKPGRERYWDGEAWSGEGRDAPPTKKKRKGGTFLKVVVGVVVGGTVFIGGCTALIAGGLNSTQKNGITSAEFDSIAQGSSQTTIEDKYGTPENSQKFEQQIPELQNTPATSSCIYYSEKGKKILEGQSFQFCFDSGRLTSKNAY